MYMYAIRITDVTLSMVRGKGKTPRTLRPCHLTVVGALGYLATLQGSCRSVARARFFNPVMVTDIRAPKGQTWGIV